MCRQVPANFSGGLLQILAVRRTQRNRLELFYSSSQNTIQLWDNESSLPGATKEENSGRHVKLAEKRIQTIGKDFTAELIAIGNTLIGRINGQTLICSLAKEDSSGCLCVRYATTLPFRDVEVLNLDGLSEAEALKIVGLAPGAKKP